MSRFAALLDHSPDPDHPHASRRVEADLTRRTGASPQRWDADGIRLWQTGASVARSSGPLTLVGDLALTDLPELRGAVAAAPDTDPATLVLAAWQRWGVGALDRLCGAFAFAVWDARTRQLTVVRDRFGIQPLVYAVASGRVVVAGDFSTVLAGLDATPDIDRAWVAEFLSSQSFDPVATAWKGVLRLPPGALMTLDHEGTTALRSWYRLELTTPPDTKDISAALRAALTHATLQACADSPTATMLSGGLDSSTLALLSVGPEAPPPDPRPALSLRYLNPIMDEGRYIQDVLHRSRGRLAPVSVPGEMVADELFDVDAQLDWYDQPVFAPGSTGTRRLYRAVRAQGCAAVLNGHGGDEVIGGTPLDIMLIARAGRWPSALKLAIQQARFTGESVTEFVARLLAAEGRRGFGRLGRWALREEPRSSVEWRRLVDPELAREVDLVERARASLRPDPADPHLRDGVRLHAAELNGALASTAFETLDRTAQAERVLPRYPFFDHRVIEMCVWQPDVAKVAGGQSRALLRGAMRGVLPESVRLRRDKTDFIFNLWTTLRQDPQGRIADFRSDPGPLRGWVNASVLQADATRLNRSPDPDPQVAFRLWRALWLATWLERGETRARPAHHRSAPDVPRPAPCQTVASSL